MPIIDTSKVNLATLGYTAQFQIYNGLDCCVTREIFDQTSTLLNQTNDPSPRLIYGFERGMQAPALDMMQRGFKIDAYDRSLAEQRLSAQIERLKGILNRYGAATWGKPLNANSPKQLKSLFYGFYGLPEQHKIDKGQRTVTTNREALEKLSAYFHVLPIINCILAIRDTVKKLSVITTEISPDGRMRTTYNVAGTETGRWSSSSDVYGEGTNLQNITDELRQIFVADQGYKLGYLDLEQAESKAVGLLVWQTVGDAAYLAACESGDLHTTVARLVWPRLGWTDDTNYNRKLADQIFYRQFSYRDMAKRGGHATNYYGTPRTIARVLKVEERVIADFQMAYFAAFVGLRRWHEWVSRCISLNNELTTPLGRTRTFFGRPGDDATLREAIAFSPQSYVGDLLNAALWRVWRFLPEVQLLAQVHDAIVFQFPEEREQELLPRARDLCLIPVTAESTITPGELKTMTIPIEVKTGWNWASSEIKTSRGIIKNPGGMMKWKANQLDERKRPRGLDRIVS
jgi:DNA polymerase I-like protein with 3'-5' exonuclease and polymerase domains